MPEIYPMYEIATLMQRQAELVELLADKAADGHDVVEVQRFLLDSTKRILDVLDRERERQVADSLDASLVTQGIIQCLDVHISSNTDDLEAQDELMTLAKKIIESTKAHNARRMSRLESAYELVKK